MSKAKKIGLILCFLLASQIVRIFLEGTYLWYQSGVQTINQDTTERIIPGAAEDLIQDQYVVHRFYKSEGFGIDSVNPNDLTLALHGSVDKLYRLIDFAEVWRGPISMSVYVPGLDASFFDDAIDGLRLCWSSLRKSVTFHAVYPKTLPGNASSVGSFVYLSCKDIIRRIRRKKPASFDERSWTYPHNVMRNVARSGVLTHYVLHLDADVIPTPHLRERFLEFVNKSNKYTRDSSRIPMSDVYVLPTFEVRQDVEPIRDKRDLVTALEDRNARPLMQETCPLCHKATDYIKWRNFLSFRKGIKLNVSYTLNYTRSWEPFFITSRRSPLYDERMTSYGHDRLSHMCELQTQGYSFHVLSDEFLLFKGYRTKAKTTEAEKRRKDDRTSFHSNFVRELKIHGYTHEKYNQCFI